MVAETLVHTDKCSRFVLETESPLSKAGSLVVAVYHARPLIKILLMWSESGLLSILLAVRTFVEDQKSNESNVFHFAVYHTPVTHALVQPCAVITFWGKMGKFGELVKINGNSMQSHAKQRNEIVTLFCITSVSWQEDSTQEESEFL